MRRFESQLLAAALLAWLVAGIVNLATTPILGYDEAAFAALARGADTPNWLYRSSGVTLLAQLGDSETLLRLPFLIVGLALPLAAFALGRAAFDARTGAWAAAVLATGHQLLGRNAHVLGDVPSVAGLLAGLAIVVGEFTREGGPRRRLLLAAPAFAAAFYFRYGSAPVIAAALVIAPLIWFRVVRVHWRIVVVTGALFGVLLVPHVIQSLDETGSVLGLLRFSAGVPRRAYIGEGLVTYVTSNPIRYYGVLVAPCMLAGLAGLALRKRPASYLVIVALAQIVTIGLTSHAQPRYVFAGVCILVVVGVAAIVTARASGRAAMRRLPLSRAALVALVLAYAWSVRWNVRANGKLGEQRASIIAAADAIRRDGDSPCIVLAASLPQLLWYSRCGAGRWYYELDAGALLPNRRRYLVETAVGNPIDMEWAPYHAVVLDELPTGHPKSRVWRLR